MISMNEFDLIRRLIPSLAINPALRTGAGDDCAVLDLGLPDHFLLFKVDAVAQDVHFTKETPPAKIGRKALARGLSDIAAMGGTPIAALVSLGLTQDFDLGFVEALYDGLNELARRYAVAIAGGETILHPGGICLSVSVLGKVLKDRCILRSGAQAGDGIFVTGALGGSLQGKHLDFEPRLVQAQWLTRSFPIHSMIDLSDGLAGDLRHLLAAGGLGAELLASAIPISQAARTQTRSGLGAKTPLLAALTDGEDFELLFTAASSDAVPLVDAWKSAFPDLRLSCIGKISKSSGILLRDAHGTVLLEAQGYSHFGKA